MGERESYRTINVSVFERDIAVFCNDCQKVGKNNICLQIGSRIQALRVFKGSCSEAFKNGRLGEMTNKGFKPYR